MKRHRTWLFKAIVSALVVVGCSPSPSVSPANSANGPTPASGFAEVPRERTVILENIGGRVAVPDNMNPYIAGQYLDFGAYQVIYESLFYYNYESGELIPWLATGFSFDDDYRTLTVDLRDGVTWSDGESFTSDDVVYTINMLKAHPQLQYGADMKQWVADVSAPDDRTVVLSLTDPNPRFVNTYFSVNVADTVLILPRHIWEGQDPATFSNFDLGKGWPVGTGPYRLVRSTETETVFDRLDNWWGSKTGFHAQPAPERAIWVGVASEDVRAAKAAANEFDAMWIFGRGSFEAARSRNPNLVAWTDDLPYAYLDPCARSLNINNGAAPFDSRDVRWAVSSAINREEVAAIAFEGMTEPAATVFPTYAPLQAFLDRNKSLFEQYPTTAFDPARTSEIMSSQGYSEDGEGFWVGRDGARVTFTINVSSGETDQVKMAPVIVDQLRNAGFEVDIQTLERAQYFDARVRGVYQMDLGGPCGSVRDPYRTFSFFHGRWVTPIGESAADPALASRFANAEFDQLVDQMAVTDPDDPAFAPLADQALEIWVRELPAIPLLQARLLTPFNNSYWTNWPTSSNNYIHPGHWWVTGNQILLNIQPTAG